MVNLISKSLPTSAEIVRIHVAGDFKSQAYFNAWVEVAQRNPDKIFYAYTKSLKFWIRKINDLPENFIMTASYGGMKDKLISQHGLRSAKVIFSMEEANGLHVDIDDSHAAAPEKRNQSFALMLHGVQPPNTAASAAWEKIKNHAV